MKRAAIWMGVLMVVLPLCAASPAFAAEPQVQLTAPGFGASPAGCAQAATQAAPLTVLERQIFSPTEVRPVDMASGCCTMFGCCTLIDSGCQTCNGGRRWYDKYSCPGGGTCTVSPNTCPTPC
jgi:hypothetical protein